MADTCVGSTKERRYENNKKWNKELIPTKQSQGWDSVLITYNLIRIQEKIISFTFNLTKFLIELQVTVFTIFFLDIRDTIKYKLLQKISIKLYEPKVHMLIKNIIFSMEWTYNISTFYVEKFLIQQWEISWNIHGWLHTS